MKTKIETVKVTVIEGCEIPEVSIMEGYDPLVYSDKSIVMIDFLAPYQISDLIYHYNETAICSVIKEIGASESNLVEYHTHNGSTWYVVKNENIDELETEIKKVLDNHNAVD